MSFRFNRSFVSLVLVVLVGSIALAGCSSSDENASTIVTTVYPFEFVAREIAGNEFKVMNVTPVGAEPHDTELTPSATAEILDAELAIVVGNGFQPAVEKTAESRNGKTLELIEHVNHDDEHASAVPAQLVKLSHGDEQHGNSDEAEESNVEDDPHLWLDPVEMGHAIEEISESIIALKPEAREDFEKRRDALLQRVESLDEEYTQGLEKCSSRTFITSHDAFSRLAHRYDLVQESIAGISPENEPSPERLTELSELVEENNITVIFTEELVSPRVAETLSNEAGITTKVLSPIEGLTKEQIEKDEDYFSLMKENLSQLSQALECSS